VVIPILTKLHSRLERWEFEDTKIKHEIWRSYISKVFHLFLFLVLNLTSYFKGVIEWLGLDSGLLDETTHATIDDAAISLIKLAFTEILILITA